MPRDRRTGISVLFGRRLRALRKLRKLTQEDLGERSAVTGKLVGQIERGFGNPTLEVVQGLARALGVSPSVLLQFEEEQPSAAGDRAAAKFQASEEVAQYLAGRSTDDIQRAFRILEAAFGDRDR